MLAENSVDIFFRFSATAMHSSDAIGTMCLFVTKVVRLSVTGVL